MDFEMRNCWIENHPEYDRGFEAGQQNKQEEFNKLQKEIDELQKRINEAVELLEYNEYTDSALQALDVLKGE